MTRPMKRWTITCILVLVVWLIVIGMGYRTPDALFLPLAAMALLSFPLGPFAAAVVILIAEVTGFYLEEHFKNPLLNVLLIWVFFYGWGALQWFVLIPALQRRRARRN